MAQKQKYRLKIQGMTCSDCANHVKKALLGIGGVDQVDLPDWSKGFAVVNTQNEVSEASLIQAVQGAGYQASIDKSSNLKNSTTYRKANLGETNGSLDYDLVVIGTGGAGMGAAIKAAELGFSCAIIEAGTVGGTCVNVGCVPSKALLRAAEAYHLAGNHAFAGIHTKAEKVDFKVVIAEKDRMVESLRQKKYIDVIAAYPKISLIHGKAALETDGSVFIDGVKRIRGRKTIIATGASPRNLSLQGIENVEILNSTTAMDLKQLPKSMIVIGGRFIALEQAQLFSRFGTDVTILQRSDRLIPDHEPEISNGISSYLIEEGLKVHTGVLPVAIREEGDQKIVTVEINNASQDFRAEQVLMAVGRSGNSAELNLESLGVKTDKNDCIIVNDALQTSNPDVYAAGDVTDRPQLVYVAAAAGAIAAENALNNANKKLDLAILPEVIFTDPQIATVGLTESQAGKKGYDVVTGQISLDHVPRAITSRNTRGLIKLILDQNTQQILGAHILAPEGGEIIQIAAMAIYSGAKYGFTVSDFKKMLFPYLVQAEGLKLASLTFNKDVSKLSCCAG